MSEQVFQVSTTNNQPVEGDKQDQPSAPFSATPAQPQLRHPLNSELTPFDIRNHIDALTPAKEKNKYICPVCEGHNLSIHPQTGKYQCFNGCECKDIREAIRPWAEVVSSNANNQTRFITPIRAKTVEPIAAPLPTKLHNKLPSQPLAIARLSKDASDIPLPTQPLAIARLSKVASDIPQPTKPHHIPKSVISQFEKKQATAAELNQISAVVYDYGDGKQTIRWQCPCEAESKGAIKTFTTLRNIDGKPHYNKGDYPWKAYRQDEAITAMMETILEGMEVEQEVIPVILWHEGEKCVEAARGERLASISVMGNGAEADQVFAMNELKSRMGDEEFIIAYLADNDSTGQKKAHKLAKLAAKAGVHFVAIDLKLIHPNLCDKGDIVDLLKSGMDGDKLASEILKQIAAIRQKQSEPSDDLDIPDSGDPHSTFLQQGFKFLYGDKPWVSAENKLYFWDGTHYKNSPDSVERPRIASYCNSYCTTDDKGNLVFPYAKPSKVKELLEWAKFRVEIDPTLLNPPGVNCINGVVCIKWIMRNPMPTLEQHNPTKHYFTYEPLIKYDPNADPTECDRLLACLDEQQQQILLRNLGASLDLEEVRKIRGREIKLLLACGLGSNGKDALRQVVSIIYGNQAITSCSLADFSNYDDGRKFSLAPLMNSRVNWASENPQTARLDRIQSLKLFATGNVLHSERKGKDHLEFIPKAVGLFNLNETPSLHGTIQAIQDRIAPLKFLKTFKSNPDPDNPNELQADPRFAYDIDFVREKVAPAFLNKMLAGLTALVSEGIDYSCTAEVFSSMQKENNHLFQFAEDCSLGYRNDGEMSAKVLWSTLEQWYKDSGTLVEEDGGRKVWIDQVRPSDKNVKGINQVIPRILQLFPKASKATRYDETSKRSIPIIKGIGFIKSEWDDQPVAVHQPAEVESAIARSAVPEAIASLKTATSWAEISGRIVQSLIDQAWQCLSQDEKARLHQMYADFQQPAAVEQPAVTNSEEAIKIVDAAIAQADPNFTTADLNFQTPVGRWNKRLCAAISISPNMAKIISTAEELQRIFPNVLAVMPNDISNQYRQLLESK